MDRGVGLGVNRPAPHPTEPRVVGGSIGKVRDVDLRARAECHVDPRACHVIAACLHSDICAGAETARGALVSGGDNPAAVGRLRAERAARLNSIYRERVRCGDDTRRRHRLPGDRHGGLADRPCSPYVQEDGIAEGGQLGLPETAVVGVHVHLRNRRGPFVGGQGVAWPCRHGDRRLQVNGASRRLGAGVGGRRVFGPVEGGPNGEGHDAPAVAAPCRPVRHPKGSPRRNFAVAVVVPRVGRSTLGHISDVEGVGAGPGSGVAAGGVGRGNGARGGIDCRAPVEGRLAEERSGRDQLD
mmetsp:Transcript_2198/g.7817  ORF Transcript_2198/g.7817 Transcript_2198/m.7817 type:complete len:298 (+) Transcript_2198:3209-4102(+)